MNVTPILTDDATLDDCETPQQRRRSSQPLNEDAVVDDRPAPPGTRRLGSRYRTEELARRARHDRELQDATGDQLAAEGTLVSAQVYATLELAPPATSPTTTSASNDALISSTTSSAVLSTPSGVMRRKSSYRAADGTGLPLGSPRPQGVPAPVDEHRTLGGPTFGGGDWDASEIMRKRRELQLVIVNLPKIAAIYRGAEASTLESADIKLQKQLHAEFEMYESAAIDRVKQRDQTRLLMAWRAWAKSEKRKRLSKSASHLSRGPSFSARLEAMASVGPRVQPRVRSFERFEVSKSKRDLLAAQRREASSRSKKYPEVRASTSNGLKTTTAAPSSPGDTSQDDGEESVATAGYSSSIPRPISGGSKKNETLGALEDRDECVESLEPPSSSHQDQVAEDLPKPPAQKKRPWFFARIFATSSNASSSSTTSGKATRSSKASVSATSRSSVPQP